MPETRRLLEAACTLSHALRAQGVPHAFHGSLFVAVLANSPQADVRPPRRSSPDGTAFGNLVTAGNFLYRRRRDSASISSRQAGTDRQRGPLHNTLSLD